MTPAGALRHGGHEGKATATHPVAKNLNKARVGEYELREAGDKEDWVRSSGDDAAETQEHSRGADTISKGRCARRRSAA